MNDLWTTDEALDALNGFHAERRGEQPPAGASASYLQGWLIARQQRDSFNPLKKAA